jgi:hypothetical protein
VVCPRRAAAGTSGFYQLPFGKSSGFLNGVVRGWQLNGIFSAQTGVPMTIVLSSDPSSTGTIAHPDRIDDGNLPADQCGINHWFDTAAFAIPSCICFSTSGRSIVRAPGFTDVDLGIIRDFQFGERFRLRYSAKICVDVNTYSLY